MSSSRQVFEKQSPVAAPAELLFSWHARPGAFERLAPPWQKIEVVKPSGGLEDGKRLVMRMALGPMWQKWVAEHHDYVAGERFSDVQIFGPFASWDHAHVCTPTGVSSSILDDRIEYVLPGGAIGRLLGSAMARRQLENVFRYRHRTTCADVAAHFSHPGFTNMKILVTGSTGLVGTALIPFLKTGGHQVTRLVRQGAKFEEPSIVWNPASGTLDPQSLEGLDAVVHLAGEGIANRRWSPAQKEKIRDSRIRGTQLLSETLAKLQSPPATYICASAIGYYGNRGDERMTEKSAAGTGFLADVCRDWEAATQAARDRGIRVVNLRIGIVLSPKGGALAQMLTPFKMGVGGVLGSGDQYMSWIALDDLIGAIHHGLAHPAVVGPVNAVSPNAVTNLEFTKTLGRVLNRPTIFPVPAFAARLVFGEMADALLLASTRVEPTALATAGYPFRYPDLETALRYLLGRIV